MSAPNGGIPGATIQAEQWNVEGNYVERLLDNASFTSAHPENTLVLAGPARKGSPLGDLVYPNNLLPIGMVQQFSVSQNKPSTPLISVGSSRNFFVTGKSQNSFQISRLFINGRNLLRVLQTQAVQAGLNLDDGLMVSPVAGGAEAIDDAPEYPFLCNLDSDLFSLPFGIAILFKDKLEHFIGGLYLELCMLNSWSIQFAAGQNFIAENVSGMFDRLVPIVTSAGTAKPDLHGQLTEDVLGLKTSAGEAGIGYLGDITK